MEQKAVMDFYKFLYDRYQYTEYLKSVTLLENKTINVCSSKSETVHYLYHSFAV